VGSFADRIRLSADIARIDSADDLVAVAKKLPSEPARIDAQVRSDDIIGRKPGQLGHLTGNRLLFGVADCSALLESRRISATRKFPSLLDEGFERRLARDLSMIPGVGRIGRQEVDQRLITLEVGE